MLNLDVGINDVARSGIRDMTLAEVNYHTDEGRILKYLTVAELADDGSCALSVMPVPLPHSHALAGLRPLQMGVTFVTDLFGSIIATFPGETRLPSAATTLRDFLIIYS